MRLILIAGLILLQFACSKQSNEAPVLLNAREYFPLDSASFWQYDVSFINIDAAVGTFDTLNAQLKMSYRNYDDSLEMHVLDRYIREDSSQAWSEYDVVTASWNKLSLHWVENNLRFVKLTDPILNNKSWNGNSFNILDDWNYYYSNLNTSFEFNGYSYDETVRVEKRDVKNVIQEQRAFEVFARYIGSVYEFEADFIYQGGEITLGNSREMILTKFGEE